MSQQITVYDEESTAVGITFMRRAKQLVSKQRALWLDETHTAIRLMPEYKEEIKLDKGFSNKTNEGYEATDGHSADIPYDKECLLCIAKKRVREKRSLLKFTACYIIVCFILLMYLGNSYYHDRFEPGFITGFMCTSGAFLACRLATYFYSRLKGTNLLRRFNQDPVEAEYNKLTMMEPGKIAMEYRRL